MKKRYDERNRTPNSKTGRSKVRVFILTGGMKQKLARQLSRQKNSIVLLIDCDEDVDRIRPGVSAHGVMVFSLGTYESLATLTEDADPRIRKAAKKVGAMLAREGSGASPTISRLAAQRLVQTREFQHALQTIVDRSTKLTNGRLPSFEIILLGSYVGGVGAGSVCVIAEAVMMFLSTLPVTVKVVFDLTGAITFTGVSPLAGQNAAATLPHLVRFAITASRPEFKLMTVHVNLSEFLPVGQDHKFRDMLTAIDEQSIRSTELQEILIRLSPNLAMSGLLGSVGTREMEIFDLIDIDREVLPTVAYRLLAQLREAREQVMSDPSRVQEMRWNPERKTLNRSSISQIVSHVDALSFDEFCRAVLRAGEDISYSWQIDMGADGELEPIKVDEYYAEPPATLSVAMQRFSLLETLSTVAEREEMFQKRDLANHQAEVQLRLPKLHKLFRDLKSPRFWQNVNRLAEQLTETAEEMRAFFDAQLDLEAQLALVQLGRPKMKVERDFLVDRLLDIENMLERYAPRGRESFRGTYVITEPLENAFADLWRLTLQTDEEQRAGLCRLAPVVSLEGLAKIVDSPVAKVDDIAEQIVRGTPVVQCPPHGGLVRTDELLKAYCLPPFDGAFAELLRKKIVDLDPSPRTVVVFNDWTDAGITVCRYTFRSFETTKELMAGLLGHDAERVKKSLHGTLRYAEGKDQREALDRLLKGQNVKDDEPSEGKDDEEPDAVSASADY